MYWLGIPVEIGAPASDGEGSEEKKISQADSLVASLLQGPVDLTPKTTQNKGVPEKSNEEKFAEFSRCKGNCKLQYYFLILNS